MSDKRGKAIERIQKENEALRERVKELEAEKAAIEYIDSLILNLLKEKGVHVEAINIGIEALAQERDSLKAQLGRAKKLFIECADFPYPSDAEECFQREVVEGK